MKSTHTTGQALVEFAIVLPVFVLALFGVLDGARLVYTYNQLSQAAREGARVAAVEASRIGSQDPACVSSESQITSSNPGAHVCPADPAALKADVVAAVNRMTVALGAIPASDIYLACDAGVGYGDPAPTGSWDESTVTFPACNADSAGNSAPTARGELVSVRVVYAYAPFTPIAGTLIGSVSLSGSATMVIN